MNTFDPGKFEQQSHPYTIKRLSPSIGAELLDLDLKKPLSEDLKDEIYQALLVYKVIFFRDQDLSIEEHLEFANNFGELEIHNLSFLKLFCLCLPKRDLLFLF